MSHADKNLKLALEVNRALQSADGNQIIKSVVRFMEHNELRANSDLVSRIPSTSLGLVE